MRRSLSLLLVLSLFAATSSHAVEILRWERLPLTVPLWVGEERVILLDHPVRVGLPPSLEARLRVQSADRAVYLLARAPFGSTRIELQDMGAGELILLDISARRPPSQEPPLEPIRIVDEGALSSPEDPAGAAGGEASGSDLGGMRTATEAPLAVALTRYAAQSFYAPLRTVEPLAGITPVSIEGSLSLDTLLPTLPVRPTALAAWRLDADWVTAVKLVNLSQRWIDLDPRLLQGDFLTATFQHPNLGPAGRSTDTTVVYLVTRGHGISGSLLPRASRFDAALDLRKPAGAQPDGSLGKPRS